MRSLSRASLVALLWCVLTAPHVIALSEKPISADPAPASTDPAHQTDSHNRPDAMLDMQGPLIDDRRRSDDSPDGATRSELYGSDAADRAIRLGSPDSRHVGYGVRHRPSNQSDGMKANQESREAWLGWRTNLTALTSTIQHTSTYAALQSSQPGTTTLQRRFALDLTLPAWPTVTVAYGQATSNSAPDPIGFTIPLNKADVLETFMTYHLSTVKLRAGTEYAVTDDLINPAGSSQRVRHGLSGSYSPLPPLTFTSSVSMTDERNHLSGQRTETPSAEIGVAYRARPDVDVSVRSSYSRAYTTAGTVDLGKFDAKSRLNWNAVRSASALATLSLETGYSTTVDLLRAAGAMDDLSALLRMTVTGTSWSDWLAR